jgi:hypothetical protein
MPVTRITNNSLATDAALNNLNAGASIAFTKPVSVAGSPTTTSSTDVLVLSRPFNPGVGFHTAASFKLSNPSSSVNNTRLDIALMQANTVTPITPDTTVMTLLGNGNVGIGTTTPNEKLTVVGNISATGNLTVDTNTLFVDSVNNRVGIGTATPGTSKLVIRNDNDSVNWLLQTQNDNGNTNSLFTQNGAGDFVWNGYRNGTSLGSPELALNTNGNSFLNGGNVGIGTSTPAAKFEVWTTYIGPTIPALGASNIGFSFLEVAGKYGLIGGVLSNGNCYLQTQRVDATATAYNLLLQSNGGNVGIGTTTPSERLTVSGNISATGNITCTGHLAAATKSFKIPHQTKAGYLQYGVVESNEHGVYVRGKTSDDTITLPDHWDWLVDSDSVTVTLTPYGSHQPLYIISADNKKVVVGGVTGEYHYVVYGTRKDVEALVVETAE